MTMFMGECHIESNAATGHPVLGLFDTHLWNGLSLFSWIKQVPEYSRAVSHQRSDERVLPPANLLVYC